MLRTNTLAYYVSSSEAKKKSFITLTTGVNVIKPFPFSQRSLQNRLGCLSLVFVSSLTLLGKAPLSHTTNIRRAQIKSRSTNALAFVRNVSDSERKFYNGDVNQSFSAVVVATNDSDVWVSML
jgi:hypothetical protein